MCAQCRSEVSNYIPEKKNENKNHLFEDNKIGVNPEAVLF